MRLNKYTYSIISIFVTFSRRLIIRRPVEQSPKGNVQNNSLQKVDSSLYETSYTRSAQTRQLAEDNRLMGKSRLRSSSLMGKSII